MTSKEFTGLAQRSVLFHVDIFPSCRESPARMLILFAVSVSCLVRLDSLVPALGA